MLSRLYNLLLMKYYKVRYGENFKCKGRLVIQGHGFYEIGNNVHIISAPYVNPVGGGRTVLQTIKNGKIIIRNNVGLSHVTLCSRNEIEIEDNVLIGGGVKIYDNDFHSIRYEDRMKRPDNNVKSKKVLIRKGAFIGANSIILKGVTIGQHCVIGAGSVVTRDVPDFEIWAGNPANKIGVTS